MTMMSLAGHTSQITTRKGKRKAAIVAALACTLSAAATAAPNPISAANLGALAESRQPESHGPASSAPTPDPRLGLEQQHFDPTAFSPITSSTLPKENGRPVVMRVNGEPVMWDEMMTQIRISGAGILHSHPDRESQVIGALYGPVSGTLISQALYRKFAREHHLQPQRAEVERQMDRVITAGNPETKAAMKLLQPGQIEQMVTDGLIHQKVDKYLGDRATSAPPTLEELTSFTTTYSIKPKAQVVLRARHIVVRATPDMSEFNLNDAKAQAEMIHERVVTTSTQQHLEFRVAAYQYSQDRFTAYLGGDLGYFAAGSLYPEANKALEKLQPGEISPVIRTSVGFHIFQLTERHHDDLRLQYETWRKRMAVQNWQMEQREHAKVEDYAGKQ